MAVTTFIPEIWSAAILSKLRDSLVYAQAGMVNRNYEGEIARAGDTVHINSVDDVSVSQYRKSTATGSSTDSVNTGTPTTISYQLLGTTEQTMIVDQADYFAFQVDDVDRRQALSGFVEESAQSAAYALAKEFDTYVVTLMAAGVTGANALGDRTVDTAGDAYDLLVEMRTRHVRSNTPDQGRWVVVPPELYAKLLRDDRFIRADASGTTSGLRNGFVGRAAGFDIIEANLVPSAGSGETLEYTVISGHGMATTVAEQISETEALRLEGSFSDAVRGLHLYGGKVVRPAQLVSSTVHVDI